jgi:hypothetical protein
VDGGDHSSCEDHKDDDAWGGSDLNMNGGGGLRTEVCAMCLLLNVILMGGARPMTGYVRVLVEI